MQTRRLGNSATDITCIGSLAWATGGAGCPYGRAAQDDATVIGAAGFEREAGEVAFIGR